MPETSAFRYRVTPYGVKIPDHVRNEFAAGHARKQSFNLPNGMKKVFNLLLGGGDGALENAGFAAAPGVEGGF